MRKLILPAIVISAAVMLLPGYTPAKIDKGPYLQNVKPSEITVCWESPEPVESVVLLVPMGKDAPASSESSVAVEAAAFSEVKLTGLRPDTQYKYMVKQKDGTRAGGTFRTAPGRFVPFRFAAYGDCRSNHLVHSQLVKAMKKYDPALVVNSGDLVNRGVLQEDWNFFWDIVSDFGADIPYYPSLGNHEQDSPLYYKYFSLPRNGGKERFYSFSYSNVFFIALDSNSPYFLMSDQKSWLREQLKKARDYDFRVVFFHHPFYSSSKREPNIHYRAIYSPIFAKYGVDLVLNGHDHFYERSVDDYGITYVVTGGGGAGLYGFERDLPQSRVRKMVHHFMIMDVDGKTMKVKSIDIDGNVFDTFELKSKNR